MQESKLGEPTTASTNRIIANLALFDSNDPLLWEQAYKETMEKKYAKGTRKFSRKIYGKPYQDPQIFLIPRVRGGPSYKHYDLKNADPGDLQYCPISKGYPQQNVSSFTLGPYPGEGLCLVNSAFSKIICIMHIEGGGKIDFKRKCFWRPARKPHRNMEIVNDSTMKVDGIEVDIQTWLKNHESSWLKEWTGWSQSIALTSRGGFNWDNGSDVVMYKAKGKYIKFQEWKMECYVKPSFKLLPKTDVFQFLHDVYHNKKISVGLVHPMARRDGKIQPMTKEYLKDLLISDQNMICQPYVIAAKLMNIEF
uniref:Uncharacterized protein n=1 Tax=Pithovirus LCPAC403 TaxID=2506596 RepID=A0A481ZAN1_9VIRU|nr:MAG: uncharacterized protein LCPAC403_01080 [Pithovirus LCPAC403]